MHRQLKRIGLMAGLLVVAIAVRGRTAWRKEPCAPDTHVRAAEAGHTPPGMVYVPGGWCLLGSNDADADDDVRPVRRAFVPSFYIDRTEVTNAQFKRFRSTYTYPPGEDNLPVTNVTYADADSYARWAGKRLPTEEEWEKAARGTDGRRYPWGNSWDARRVAARAHHAGELPENTLTAKRPGQCALGTSRVQPVGSARNGASPYGCLDMAGNAWEWVQGFYQGNREQRILRGGAVGYGERSCRTYARAVEGAGVT